MRYLFIFIIPLLVSCNRIIAKNTSTFTEKIDTSINIINPLKKLSSKNFLFNGTKIEHEFFTVTTTYDKKSGELETVFEPKKEVFVNVEMTKETITESKTFSQNERNYAWELFLFTLSVVLGSAMFIIIKLRKK